jgi:GMP synthase PP-ATPase subunit
MAEENESRGADKPELNLADAIYTSMGIPEIEAQILVLFALQSRVLAILLESGLLRKEQVEEVINHASERIATITQTIQENAISNKETFDVVVEGMQEAATKRLNEMRERLNLST